MKLEMLTSINNTPYDLQAETAPDFVGGIVETYFETLEDIAYNESVTKYYTEITTDIGFYAMAYKVDGGFTLFPLIDGTHQDSLYFYTYYEMTDYIKNVLAEMGETE